MAKLRIINKTRWNTRHLTAFIRRVAEEELNPDQLQYLMFRFVTRRTSAVSDAFSAPRRVGYLPPGLQYNHCVVRLPATDATDHTKRLLALFIAHEMAECRGLPHKAMRTPRYFTTPGWEARYQWAGEFPLAQRAIIKAKRLRARPLDVRLAHAVAMVAKWSSRAKLAATKMKRWKRRLGQYRRQADATAPQDEHAH